MLQKFQNVLPRHSLFTIYKTFVKHHLDYGGIILDKVYIESFHNKLSTVRCNAALAMTGAIRGTNIEKLHQGLGLEFLENRSMLRRLCRFYKI